MSRDNPPDVRPIECAEKLKVLGEPIRLRLLEALQTGPLAVGDLAELIEIPLMLVSHHLKILLAHEFVDREKEGRFVYYSLRPEVLHLGKLNLGCCELTFPPQAAAGTPQAATDEKGLPVPPSSPPKKS